jgi:hypothetical protein
MNDWRRTGYAIRFVTLILVLALTPLVQAQSVRGPSWTQPNLGESAIKRQ